MKYILPVIFILTSLSLYGQKIKKDYIDDFEDIRIIETDWHTIKQPYSFFRVVSINNELFLDYKRGLKDYTTIEEGDIYKLKLQDKSVHALKNLEYTVTSKNAAKHKWVYNKDDLGVNLKLHLSSEIVDLILSPDLFNIEKARLITTDGFVAEKWGEKTSKKLRKCVRLVKAALSK